MKNNIYTGVEDMARKLAVKAKPGIITIGKDIYTFVFNQQTWKYDVYENGFLLMSYNTKSLKTAKEWLKQYLAN